MTEYSYTATKGADGKFSAILTADGKNIATSPELRNEKAAKSWAQVAALAHKRDNLAPAFHGEQHTVYGSFEL